MNDLDLTLKALGTQVAPIIKLVESYSVAERPSAYATAINTLASMAGGSDPKNVKLGIAVAFSRAGAHKPSIDQAARIVGAM